MPPITVCDSLDANSVRRTIMMVECPLCGVGPGIMCKGNMLHIDRAMATNLDTDTHWYYVTDHGTLGLRRK